MKRSEMISKLERYVSWLAGGLLTSKEIKEAGSRLLEIVEDNGMAPPAVWFDHENEDKELANKWEREDEF